MKQFMKKLFRNESGGVFIMVAVAIPVLFAGLALAVDYNRYLNARTHITNAVDQATLAAVSIDITETSDATREEIVQRFFETNFPEHMQSMVTIKDIKITESFPPGGPLKLTAVVTAELKNAFGGFVGLSTTKIKHRAQASRDMQSGVEVILTMASSGTMCSHKSRKPAKPNAEIEGDVLISLEPDPKCSHFNALRDGVKYFIETMQDNQTISDFKIGLVPYNFKVDLGTSNIPSVLATNEPSGWYADTSDAGNLAPVVPLTSDIGKLTNALNAMRLTPDDTAWSRSNIATLTAGLMMDPKMTSAHFPTGETPKAYGDKHASKVIILMTDGVNSGCCFTNWQPGNFDNQYVYFYKPDNDEQLALCKMLKENGVRIYSVLFDVKAGDPGGDEINRVFAECALPIGQAAPKKGLTCSTQHNCYSVSTAQDLRRVYVDIAQTFYDPNLTQ